MISRKSKSRVSGIIRTTMGLLLLIFCSSCALTCKKDVREVPADEAVNAQLLTQVTYTLPDEVTTGTYKRISKDEWSQTDPDGKAYTYRVVSEDENRIVLQDTTREKVSVELRIRSREVIELFIQRPVRRHAITELLE